MSRKRPRDSTAPNSPTLTRQSTLLSVRGADATTRWEGLAALWTAGVLCDATIIVDGRTFAAHRVILAASSAYMKCAFSTGMSESRSATITLDELGAAVFEACLTWMYKGVCTLEEQLLPDLLQAASRLQMLPLLTEVESLVAGRLCAANAVSTWMLGDALTRPALVEAARGAVVSSFAEASAAPDFLRVPAAWLESLLADDGLGVDKEEAVYASLTAWHAAQQPPPAPEEVGRLLSLVRWPLMDKAFIKEQVNSDALVTGHPDGHLILLNAFLDSSSGALPRRRLGGAVECRFESAFDTNGVLYHIGTAGGTEPYANPHVAGRVVAAMSSVGGLNGSPARFVHHQHTDSVSNYTIDAPDSWMSVDLGEGRSLLLSHYCLRADRHASPFKLRNWVLEGSHDGISWVTLRTHSNDTSIANVAMAAAAWEVAGATEAFRHFRIRQTGENSIGSSHLMCAGIELYGTLSAGPPPDCRLLANANHERGSKP